MTTCPFSIEAMMSVMSQVSFSSLNTTFPATAVCFLDMWMLDCVLLGPCLFSKILKKEKNTFQFPFKFHLDTITSLIMNNNRPIKTTNRPTFSMC